jgi:hypothetical protein
MDLAFWASWVSVFVNPFIPLKRRERQVLLSIFIKNPLEFRVARLVYQIRNLAYKKS